MSTSLNIILSDVIVMDIVDFNYGNTNDYNSAKNVNVPNRLFIISSRNFDIKVKSEGHTL
ncbi:hypothetical protein [Chryseobacterium viscerum]|uniref:hypothetical protein n=1 Tax=Chryseobacterium viscerum TaxID=1037377 RepID=UPI001E3F895F|nr:hypothetical protein [Chryseobacterium viscerum]